MCQGEERFYFYSWTNDELPGCKKIGSNCPQYVVLGLLLKIGPNHGCLCVFAFSLMGYYCLYNSYAFVYSYYVSSDQHVFFSVCL